jgi:hypothetical protein
VVILFGFASIVGGAATSLLLWPYGAAPALLCAPFGGSLAAAIAGLLVAVRRSAEDRLQRSLEASTDSMVRALRQVSEAAKCPSAEPRRPSHPEAA